MRQIQTGFCQGSVSQDFSTISVNLLPVKEDRFSIYFHCKNLEDCLMALKLLCEPHENYF